MPTWVGGGQDTQIQTILNSPGASSQYPPMANGG